MNTVYKFEITPFHPTRKVYDSVIYPAVPDTTVFCYEKDMTVQQAIAAMNTCAYMKVNHNGQWYPVTKETIDDIIATIDAGETPTVTAVDAGVRTMQSYLVSVEADTDAYGLPAGVLGNVTIDNDNVYGVLYPVTNYTGFSSDAAEQSGYFFPFGWTTNEDFKDAKMRVVNGKNPTNAIALDPVNVVFLGENVEVGGSKIIEITATDKDDNTVSLALQMKYLKFDMNASPYIAPKSVTPDPAPVVKNEDDVVG